MREKLGLPALGVALGFVLHRIGFASWSEVHAMFTFASLRLTLSFALGVTVLAVGWTAVRVTARRPGAWPPRPIHSGTIPGGVLFGVGWALCGACPGIVAVQLGAGNVLAGWTLVGILAGNALYGVAWSRLFHGTQTSCAED